MFRKTNIQNLGKTKLNVSLGPIHEVHNGTYMYSPSQVNPHPNNHISSIFDRTPGLKSLAMILSLRRCKIELKLPKSKAMIFMYPMLTCQCKPYSHVLQVQLSPEQIDTTIVGSCWFCRCWMVLTVAWKRAQQLPTLLGTLILQMFDGVDSCVQTGATTPNIVGDVDSADTGWCRQLRANGRNNSQHCWGC